MSEREAFKDDPAKRAVVEAMLVSLYGNAYSVLRDGEWLGTFPGRETAERYWPPAGDSGHE